MASERNAEARADERETVRKGIAESIELHLTERGHLMTSNERHGYRSAAITARQWEPQ